MPLNIFLFDLDRNLIPKITEIDKKYEKTAPQRPSERAPEPWCSRPTPIERVFRPSEHHMRPPPPSSPTSCSLASDAK